ncbi:MAG: hypothetical protein AB7L84_00765 [Acidimicrobiia bacterium]
MQSEAGDLEAIHRSALLAAAGAWGEVVATVLHLRFRGRLDGAALRAAVVDPWSTADDELLGTLLGAAYRRLCTDLGVEPLGDPVDAFSSIPLERLDAGRRQDIWQALSSRLATDHDAPPDAATA